MNAPDYTYRFTVCPDDQWGFNQSVFQVFEALNARLEMRMTESDFERFRLNLSHNGFSLREVERTACDADVTPKGHAAA